jgi:hypothetical protein
MRMIIAAAILDFLLLMGFIVVSIPVHAAAPCEETRTGSSRGGSSEWSRAM